MKKKFILLSLLAVLACGALQAQTEKGRWLVGATTSGLSFSTRQNLHAFNANLNPTVGYFAADNLAVGLRLNTYFSASNDYLDQKYRNYGFGVSAFGRYYIPLTERLKVPVDLQLGMNSGATRYPGSNSAGSAFTVGAHTGLSYFINSHVSLDLLAGYSGYKPISNPLSKSLTGGLDAQLGFSIYLGGGTGK